MVSTAPPLSPAVVIHVGEAVWELTRLDAADPPLIGAELHLISRESGQPVTIHRASASRWALEESLGFAIPAHAYQILLAAPAGSAAVDSPATMRASWSQLLQWRPTRGSSVLLADGTFTSYGRLLYENPPSRVWEHSDYRIDIVDLTVRDDHAQQVSFRFWHDSSLVVAGDITVAAALGVDDDDLIRWVAEQAVARRTAESLTARQRDLLAAHGPRLLRILAPPHVPYPTGTRIALLDDDGRPSAITAVVMETIEDGSGGLWYGIRPDISRLPGHPLRHHPTSFVALAADTVMPTLRSPSSGIEPILCYGARIRAIDHPGLENGTVLRAFPHHGRPIYEIQPDNLSQPPLRLHARDIEPLAGTMWQTIDALVAARQDAGLPLRAGEVLVSMDNYAFAEKGPAGPRLRRGSGLPRRDPLFGEIWERPHHEELPAPAPDHTLVRDPSRGILAAPTGAFTSALHRSLEDLGNIVRAVPGLEVTGTEPIATLAALAAIHSPLSVTTNQPPSPGGGETPPEFGLE